MKKKYIEPQIEVEKIEIENIICASPAMNVNKAPDDIDEPDEVADYFGTGNAW